MARSRNIKPSFFQNEELGELLPIERLAFIGMWTIADFKGCFEFRPKRLKVQLLPYDDCDFESIAINLEKSGFISIYSVQGQRYIKIINFEKHQNPHKNERESGSEIPDINKRDDLTKKINNLENIENYHDKNGTARADSLLLNPDSLLLIPDSNGEVTHISEYNTSNAPKPEATVCLEIKKHGITDINPANPILTELIKAGASIDEFSHAASSAVSKGKPNFSYVLGIVKRQREEAAKLVLHKGALQTAPPRKKSIHEIRAETAKAMFGDLSNGNNNPRIIDVSDDTAASNRPAIPANGKPLREALD